MAEHSSRTAVIAALAGNIAIAVTKGFAAAFSGSSAMLSESVHSLVDSLNELLLLYGQHRSRKAPDRLHPLGYGREIYFWSFVVSLLVFALGAGISIYEGVIHVRNPEPMTDPRLNYVVYGASALFEGISWGFGWSAFKRVRGDKPILAAVEASKDPPTFMVLFEDSAALVGLAIAALATALSIAFAAPWIDGAGSILIGLVLAVVAVLLARETKDLLIGERAIPELSQSIREVAERQPGVIGVEGILTSQLGPEQVIANVGLEFADDLRTSDIERLIGKIETELRTRHPELFRVFVRPHPDKYQGEVRLLDVGPA
ncbi:MAG TPA: cation diffusion facilitator family transporter [Sphingomicrobium sp.]|nr:cation diffusion facilitator family transporter [Sphingomicrobium sp.]